MTPYTHDPAGPQPDRLEFMAPKWVSDGGLRRHRDKDLRVSWASSSGHQGGVNDAVGAGWMGEWSEADVKLFWAFLAQLAACGDTLLVAKPPSLPADGPQVGGLYAALAALDDEWEAEEAATGTQAWWVQAWWGY